MKSNQVKETLERYDASVISDIDLIRPLLNDSVVDSLINKYNITKISDISMLDFENIIREDNCIGRSSVQKLKAILEIYKRDIKKDYINKISKPQDIYELCAEMKNYDQEHLRVICLNTKNSILSMKDIFIGGLNSSLVHPREIFKEALKLSSANIIIVHNHPSGDPTPSKDDINVTNRIKECSKFMGIDLLDHVIVGDRCISLKEKGLL